jgi:hypothetical protein
MYTRCGDFVRRRRLVFRDRMGRIAKFRGAAKEQQTIWN